MVCRHEKVIQHVCQYCLKHVEEAPLVYLFQRSENAYGTSGRAL